VVAAKSDATVLADRHRIGRFTAVVTQVTVHFAISLSIYRSVFLAIAIAAALARPYRYNTPIESAAGYLPVTDENDRY
jgi:hypothetical protein